MKELNQLLVFTIDKHEYALPYSVIDRVVQAVEITPLPNATENIMGIINVHGFVIPVINLRKKMGVSDKELELSDKFIIIRIREHSVGLIADKIHGMIEIKENQLVLIKNIVPSSKLFSGTLKLENNLLLIYDADEFLSAKEKTNLQKILKK
jgi:purine-binding chemotaxis protein CheW